MMLRQRQRHWAVLFALKKSVLVMALLSFNQHHNSMITTDITTTTTPLCDAYPITLTTFATTRIPTMRHHHLHHYQALTRRDMSPKVFPEEGPIKTSDLSIVNDDKRRTLMLVAIAGGSLVPSAPALATESNSNNNNNEVTEGLVSTSSVADRLRVVPTFTLVDVQGVPYMVVGEDAKVTGYFFASYEEAKRILALAKQSADKGIQEALQELRVKRKQEGLPATLSKQQELDLLGISSNPWSTARVSSVPLDVAVTLVTKSMYGTNRSGGNYFQVAPSESDVEDALALDKNGKTELAEGKVPLFYMADFTILRKGDENEEKSPLYFRKSQLISDWKKNNPKVSSDRMPEILVTELFAVLAEMVKPSTAGGGSTDNDDELKTLVFVPPPESEQKAKECRKQGGKQSPFLLGQRNVVL